MLVAAQFDKKIKQTINDLVYSLRPDLKLLCCGSLEGIAESLMQKCYNCQKLITLLDSKNDEKMWILFILNKKNDILKDRLLDICSGNIRTFKDISMFFDSAKVHCRICVGKSPKKRFPSHDEKEVKKEPEDETAKKETKPPNGQPGLLETAPVKTSDKQVKTEKEGEVEEKNIKKEDNTVSPKIKRARIETIEPVEVKREQIDEMVEHQVETGVNPASSEVKRARIEEDKKVEKKANVGNRETVTVKAERIIPFESESSDMDSDDSDFFTENRKTKKITKKSLESSKCIKMLISHKDISQYRDNVIEEEQYSNDSEESEDADSDNNDRAAASNSLGNCENSDSKKKDPFECPHCGREFTRKCDLKRHLVTHTGEHPYECQHCGKKYTQSNNLKAHVRKFHFDRETASNSLGNGENSDSKKKGPFECPHCGREFTTTSDLKRHLITHSDEQPYECLQCGNKYTQSHNLKGHVRTAHLGERPYKCLECNQTFTRSGHLANHIKAIHRDDKPFECDVCQKRFNRKGHLSRHSMIHKGIKAFNCDICKKGFSRKERLDIHKRKHEEK